MAQGSAGLNILSNQVSFKDSASLDAFSRLRVSSPSYVFDAQLTYNLRPLVIEQITSGSGAAIAHDATNRCATLTFASTPTGGSSYLQTFEYFHYQPGRSQAAFLTFNFIEAVANVKKFAGLSDGVNGIELQQDGTTVQLALLSTTANGNQLVPQASWNLDKLNGTGSSGITLNLTKAQILVIDLQALYVGRVRVGFDIAGNVVYVHEFVHANAIAVPYIQTANLPVRMGMTCTGTVSTTMRAICMSVSSEGGQQDEAGMPVATSTSVTAASGAATHAISIRPKATFNSLSNRSKFVLDSIEILAGANPVTWQLAIGQAISGTTTFADVNTTYSSMEVNTAGTLSGSPSLVVASGYISSSNVTRGSGTITNLARTPITLSAAGAARALGTLTLILTGVGGTSACQVSVNWKEVR